jgi:flagellin
LGLLIPLVAKLIQLLNFLFKSEINMLNINTNVNASFAQSALTVNSRLQTTAMQQLSTGKQINSAKDNAAGLAISETMTSQIRGLNMAVRNANDGISYLQTAEGAMIEQTNMLQRMRELAVQAASDTVDTNSKGYLNTEFSSLRSEIDRIGGNTQWNGKAILKGANGTVVGAAGSGATATVTFHVGAGTGASGATFAVIIGDMSTTGAGSALTAISGDAISVASAASANAAITALDTALGQIATQRSNIGATMNRLTYAADNLTNIAQNTTDSRSRILDTDYATATTQLSKTQIISQAATAMLAQANQQQQSVLALLK